MAVRLKILSFKLGQLQTNSYIVADEESREAIVIDPADSGEFLTQKISENEYNPKAIVATHGHFDHILAATYLRLTLKIPFLVNKRDVFLVERMQESAKHFTGADPGPNPTVDQYLEDGQKIELGNLSVVVISTPGHTPGSVSLFAENACFVGDLIFPGGGVGRIDFSYSSRENLEESVNKILSLPADTILYPGHGEAGIVEDERRANYLYKAN